MDLKLESITEAAAQSETDVPVQSGNGEGVLAKVKAPPCCEAVPRLYQSSPKRCEGQRTGSLFPMRRQARPAHHLVANGTTGLHLNVGFYIAQAGTMETPCSASTGDSTVCNIWG